MQKFYHFRKYQTILTPRDQSNVSIVIIIATCVQQSLTWRPQLRLKVARVKLYTWLLQILNYQLQEQVIHQIQALALWWNLSVVSVVQALVARQLKNKKEILPAGGRLHINGCAIQDKSMSHQSKVFTNITSVNDASHTIILINIYRHILFVAQYADLTITVTII